MKHLQLQGIEIHYLGVKFTTQDCSNDFHIKVDLIWAVIFYFSLLYKPTFSLSPRVYMKYGADKVEI